MKSVSFIHIDLNRTCTINFLPFAFGDIELEMEDMVPGSIEHGLQVTSRLSRLVLKTLVRGLRTCMLCCVLPFPFCCIVWTLLCALVYVGPYIY
jgi:hypothetical protein